MTNARRAGTLEFCSSPFLTELDAHKTRASALLLRSRQRLEIIHDTYWVWSIHGRVPAPSAVIGKHVSPVLLSIVVRAWSGGKPARLYLRSYTASLCSRINKYLKIFWVRLMTSTLLQSGIANCSCDPHPAVSEVLDIRICNLPCKRRR